jgi:hypothetical protein
MKSKAQGCEHKLKNLKEEIKKLFKESLDIEGITKKKSEIRKNFENMVDTLFVQYYVSPLK